MFAASCRNWRRPCGALGDKDRIMTVVTTLVGALALIAMGYLAVLLLRGGEGR